MLDINILLLWQDFRNGAGDRLTDFMTKMSYIGKMKTMLIITALIYWCAGFLLGWILVRHACYNHKYERRSAERRQLFP